MSALAELERRLESVAELAVQIASGNLDARLRISERVDRVDAVITALNMLAEELQHERSNRRRAEELLQDELDGYEHAPALFCSVDAESLVVEKCNQSLAAALQRPKPSILGSSVLELYASDQRARAERALRSVTLAGSLEHGDAELRSADGSSLLVSASATRIRGSDERERLRIIWRDVTKERSLEAQLMESQKLESLGRLCGGIAHDFNNILAVIGGAASLMRDLLAEQRLDTEDVALIQQAVERGAALVSDLLAFSRKQVVKPVPTNVRDILEKAARMVSRLVGAHVQVELDSVDSTLSVLIDPSQLSQVLVNLVINARDAMPGGGTLRLTATRMEVPRGPPDARGSSTLGSSDHWGLSRGSYVLISISDTGSGMSPSVMARAFEPFFTTKPVGSGSGLGLSMCYGIIQQAGGRIRIDSQLGRGTTVHVHLPRSGVPPRPASRPEGLAIARGGRETLLVVEDDLAVCNVTRRVLERAGYDVIVAENGRSALEAVERSGSELALVVTDIAMPGMTGQELGAELRSRRPEIKILYLSGYSSHVLTDSGSDTPDTHFLGKPFTSSALLEKVRRLLERPG